MENICLNNVDSHNDLKETADKYFTSVVNVTGDVHLYCLNLENIPVQFGTVGKSFYCHNNSLTSLKGAPKECGYSFTCSNNQITSLEGIHKLISKINGRFYCSNNPIKSGGIGLLLIEGLYNIRSGLPAFKIINKYVGQGKTGILRCQEELIENGYEDYARL